MAEGGQNEENLQYGSCESSNAMYVKLISSDGHEFIIKKEYALMSKTIKDLLSGYGKFAESESIEINLREITSHILQVICRFLTYKATYSGISIDDLPEFPIPPEIALDVMLAANFLKC